MVLEIINAEVAQLVERNLAKVEVASSSLVFRSISLQEIEGFFVLQPVRLYLWCAFRPGGGMVDTQDLKSCGR